MVGPLVVVFSKNALNLRGFVIEYNQPPPAGFKLGWNGVENDG